MKHKFNNIFQTFVIVFFNNIMTDLSKSVMMCDGTAVSGWSLLEYLHYLFFLH